MKGCPVGGGGEGGGLLMDREEERENIKVCKSFRETTSRSMDYGGKSSERIIF